MKHITCKGGPLDGKHYTVPEHATQLTGMVTEGGKYRVKGKTATWTPDKDTQTSPEAENSTKKDTATTQG